MGHPRRLLLGALISLTLIIAGLPAAAAPVSAAPREVGRTVGDTTSAKERRRVDRVSPKLTWRTCGKNRCAKVAVPLDYDNPKAGTISLALLKVPAKTPSRRIGTLFVNPGGPGASGVELAKVATRVFSPALLDRFDIVGFDPRGTGASTPLRCFRSPAAQEKATGALDDLPFPHSIGEVRRYVRAATARAKGCSSTGRRIASAMSTAQVARDLDVLRRLVGDRTLSYLGFSYGTYLGQVYANLFPDRVRALALDGVIDPSAWAGTPATGTTPVSLRIGSGQAAWRALLAGLDRCRSAGPDYCELTDPHGTLSRIMKKLKKSPAQIGDFFDYTYQDLSSDLLGMLYDPEGMELVTFYLSLLEELLDEGSAANQAGLTASIRTLQRRSRALAAAYDSDSEAYSAVMCTDSLNPSNPYSWLSRSAAVEKEAGLFGPMWGWASTSCATTWWKARDEDAYRGPFTRRTAAPLLFVGNLWDPATSYAGASAAHRLAGSSHLITSDSWGHTAYGSSTCVTGQVDAYLLRGARPSQTRCTGRQPFTEPLTDDEDEDWGDALAAGLLPMDASRE